MTQTLLLEESCARSSIREQPKKRQTPFLAKLEIFVREEKLPWVENHFAPEEEDVMLERLRNVAHVFHR